MRNIQFNPGLLVPLGKLLLCGTFGVTLVQSMRGKLDLSLCFERLVLGFVALTFYSEGALTFEKVGNEMVAMISSVGGQADLRALIQELYQKTSQVPSSDGNGSGSSLNVPVLLEQAWRTGVWGVMTALVEGVFLIASFVLECAREVFWQLLLFLFPLACGFHPLMPRILTQIALHALELTLWLPMLCLVEKVTGSVARNHLFQEGSLGLYLVAVQVVGIGLILSIPLVTHRFLGGAFSGDFNAQAGVLSIAQRVVQAGKSVTKG